MSYLTYRLLHIGGLVMVFMALGSMLIGRDPDSKPPKIATILHGVGLLVILVAGFGMAARRDLDLTSSLPWLWAKLGLWVLIGAMPVLIRKHVIPFPLAWPLALAAGVASEWLAYSKPWM